MRLSARIVFMFVLVGFGGGRLHGDIVLFDDRIDSQQKTEIRYDVPDGCVITGLGFRAQYDNITTMHVRHHRLTAEGKLTDAVNVRLGSEADHACEAKIDLPDGWVAVGFGAAGEPEWDVTLLRIWARQLQPDGTLGKIRTFNNGFKPDREPERQAVLSDPDRVLQPWVVCQVSQRVCKAFGELTDNIAVMRHGDGSWGIEKIGGRWSWAIGPGRPCLYLDFPGGPLKEPADYILSFEYFDKGDWTIHCHYDSAYPLGDKREYRPAEPLQLTDTGTWKKGSFVLTNCRFGSRQNDRADMRFVAGAGANIRNIRLALKPTGGAS